MTSETFNLKSRMDQMMSDWTDEERKGFLVSLIDSMKLPTVANSASGSDIELIELIKNPVVKGRSHQLLLWGWAPADADERAESEWDKSRLGQLCAEISSLRSSEDRLRALHLRTDYGYVGGHICDHCGVTYPCETIQILGEAA